MLGALLDVQCEDSRLRLLRLGGRQRRWASGTSYAQFERTWERLNENLGIGGETDGDGDDSTPNLPNTPK